MYTVYSYWNADQVYAVLNAIAMIMNGGDYLGLVKAIAIAGILVAAGTGLVKMKGEEPLGYFIIFALFYGTLFVPKVTVTVQDIRTNTVYTVANVPLGVAFLSSQASHIGKWLTESFETNFTAVDDEKFSRTGMAFGARLIEELQIVKARTPALQQSLITFVKDCVNPELLDNPVALNDMVKSTDIWGFIGGSGSLSLNPGRITNIFGSAVPCIGSGGAYSALTNALNTEANTQASVLGDRLNSGNPFATMIILSQIPAIEASMLNVSRTAQDAIKQGIVMNLMRDSQTTISQVQGNPHAVQVAMAVSMAEQSSGVSYSAMAKVAQGALPKLRNAVELISMGVFPFIFIMIVLAGTKAGMVLKSYAMAIFWVQLWAPLFAIINFMATKSDRADLLGVIHGAGGNTMENMGQLANVALSNQSIAGLLTISVPIIALALVKGGEVAMSGVVSSIMSPAQGAAQKAGDAAGQGNVNAGNVSWGNTNANNWSGGNWSGGNSSFGMVSGNKQDLSSGMVDPKMSQYTDQYGSDTSTRGSGHITSAARSSSLGSITPTAQRASDRSNGTFSGTETSSATRATAALSSSLSTMTTALNSAGFGKEFGNSITSGIASGNTYSSASKGVVGASAEKSTTANDSAQTSTIFQGNAGFALKTPGGGSSGASQSISAKNEAASGSNSSSASALSKLASSLPASASAGMTGGRAASVGSGTQLQEAIKSVLSNDQAYQTAKDASDRLAKTGSTSDVRSMASQFSAALQTAKSASQSLEASVSSGQSAGTRQTDNASIGGSVAENLSDATYQKMDSAGFSRAEARAALGNASHPRHGEATQAAFGTVSASGSNGGVFAKDQMNGPRSESAVAIDGQAAVSSRANSGAAAVKSQNNANQSTAAIAQAQQMAHGKSDAPSNLTSTDAVGQYASGVQQAKAGAASIKSSSNERAGVAAFTSYAYANDLASKGVLGAVFSQPDANRGVSQELENAMAQNSSLRDKVAQAGQMKSSGLQIDESLMQEIASGVAQYAK